MGLLEDVSTWVAFYIVRPAIDAFKKHATTIEKAWANVVEWKLRHFIWWVGTLNTTVKGYIHNKINEALEDVESGTWNFFGWIDKIIDHVFDSIKNLFVRVSKLSNEVLKIISDWWKTARDTLLRTLKDTFVSIADFTIDVTKIILDFGYEAFSVIIKTVGNMISTAVAVIATTVANLVESVATSISNIIESVATAAAKIMDALSDLAVKIAEDIAETAGDFATLISDKIGELYEFIEKEVPNMVGGLFDWAKPVIQPIVDAVGFLKTIMEIVTGTREEDPAITEHREKITEQQETLEELVDGLR